MAMEQHISIFSMVTEGAPVKLLQFIMPQKSVYNKNFGFVEQKCIFEHYIEA
jgi:hypothetical protein